MRTTQVLPTCMGDSLDTIHALRVRVLMRAVARRRLMLMDRARS